jgi:hypothetical protein
MMQLTQFDGGSIVGALNGQLKQAKIRLMPSSARQNHQRALADYCVPFGSKKKA